MSGDESMKDEQIKVRGFYLSDRDKDLSEDEDVPEATVYKKKDIDAAIANAKDESKHDHDYRYIADPLSVDFLPASLNKTCAFCNRLDEPTVGPFCKIDESRET